MKKNLHILMLEDDPLDAELNKEQLLLLDEYDCKIHLTPDKTTYLKALEETTPDIILSDYKLPQYTGLEALNDLKQKNTLIPFVFVTGTLNEETAADTIKAGAWDYVVKDRLFRLPFVVRSVLKLKEEKETAAKAEEKVLRLLTAIEETSAQIIVTNQKGKIEYVNKRFMEITGFKTINEIGTESVFFSPIGFGLQDKPEVVENLQKGLVFRGEVLNKRKDGSSFWELISITPIKNEENKIINYVAVKEDITQLKKMEEELMKALNKAERSDKLKELFLQNLSHEIRTPLNAIVGFSDILHNSITISSEKFKEYTSIIIKNSNQLLSIVSNILTIASIQTGQETINKNKVDINKMLDQLHILFASEAETKKILFHIIRHFPDHPLVIVTDETKLLQILTNLLDNAIKFTHHGFVELSTSVNDNQIKFTIKDTGIGITKDDQLSIFERFHQANESIHVNYGGTGLGLSIARSFAEMLSGSLSVESEPEKGSTFSLSIPYSPESSLQQPDQKIEISQIRKKLIILIAEDEIFNFLLLKEILESSYISVLHAENGKEAIQLCKENPQIDLVLMDIKMPEMDGITAFHYIKDFRQDLPVIAVTAYALELDKQELLNIGFHDYIPKPIYKEDLLEKINKIISK